MKRVQNEASDMLLLGLLLAGATAAFVGLLIAYNLSGGPNYTVTMFGNNLVSLNHLSAFLAGIALTLVFGLGLAMMAAGAAHHRRRSVRLRSARRQADVATAERDELASRMDARGGTDRDQVGATREGRTAARHHRPHIFGH
ncbi:hypothetical protein ACIQGZ_29350 [Streptomyces sp. NPDC092296]|uniref:hypothetical protein n=1 Tax=Streptomyces sp. NPDC092296 TaxID=3366012 RepID=UPI0037F9C4AC